MKNSIGGTAQYSKRICFSRFKTLRRRILRGKTSLLRQQLSIRCMKLNI